MKKLLSTLKLCALLAIIVGIPLYIAIGHPEWIELLKDRTQLNQFLLEHEAESAWILLAIQVTQIVIAFLPGQIAQFCGGYVLGIGRGYLVTIAGAVLGTTIAYLLAKVLGKDAVELFFGRDKTADITEKIGSGRAYAVLFLLYLIPMVPKDAIAYVCGAAVFRLKPLLVLSLTARTPAMLIGIAMGYQLRTGSVTGLIALGIVSAALIAVCVWKRNALLELLDRYSKEV